MESLVVTLETAKKLKSAGFPQRGFDRVWTTPAIGLAPERFTLHHVPDIGGDYAAPTAQEIADELPKTSAVMHAPHGREKWEGFHVGKHGATRVYADTMAEALANLWLKLNVEGKIHGR